MSEEGARADLEQVVGRLAPGVAEHVLTSCRDALGVLARYLPTAERVAALTPVGPSMLATVARSLLVLTDQRVLYVSGAPQAREWLLMNLGDITYTQVSEGWISLTTIGSDQRSDFGCGGRFPEAAESFVGHVWHYVTAYVLSGGNPTVMDAMAIADASLSRSPGVDLAAAEMTPGGGKGEVVQGIEAARAARPMSEPAGRSAAEGSAQQPLSEAEALAAAPPPPSRPGSSGPATAARAGWHPDPLAPAGRYRLRYWDGQRWTNRVE